MDVSFDGDVLPPINTVLVVEWDRPEPLILEVHSHVDPVTARGIALQATTGLARSTPVRATGAPISVPVGDAILGRLIDVVGTLATAGLPCHPIPRDAVYTIRRRCLRMRPRPPQCSRLASPKSGDSKIYSRNDDVGGPELCRNPLGLSVLRVVEPAACPLIRARRPYCPENPEAAEQALSGPAGRQQQVGTA